MKLFHLAIDRFIDTPEFFYPIFIEPIELR